MQAATRAIVIHSFPYSDTSLIIKCYCENGGYQSFLAKGFKRNKKNRSVVYPLSQIEVSYRDKKGDGLRLATKIESLQPFSELLFDPIKSSIAMFLAEVLSYSLSEDKEGDPYFYSWLSNALESLEHIESPANFHLWFLFKLSEFLGFEPQYSEHKFFNLKEGHFMAHATEDCIDERDSKLLASFLNKKLEECLPLQLNKKDRWRLLYILKEYYEIHLDKRLSLKTLDVLQQIFE